MMNVRRSLCASTVVFALTLAPEAMAQAPTASPPSTVDTRIGQLKYEGGFPAKETVEKLYNEMDFQRAVLAYQYAEPLVALNEMNVGLKKIDVFEGDVVVMQRFLDPHGVVKAAAKPIEEIRIYPLTKKDNPTKTKAVPATGTKWYSISPEGFDYWERVAGIVNRIPVDQDGAFLLSLLKPLGIEQGKPFKPDARQKKILTEASRVGWAMDQAISMAPRAADAIIYPGKHW